VKRGGHTDGEKANWKQVLPKKIRGKEEATRAAGKEGLASGGK
jgi:hypothetical protein